MTIDAFKTYLATTHMTFSYKAVAVLALLESVDQHGKASHDALILAFQSYYLDRQQKGLPSRKSVSATPPR